MHRIFFIIVPFFLISCISTKLFKELQGNYDTLKEERDSLVDSLQSSFELRQKYKNDVNSLREKYFDEMIENNQLKQDYEAQKTNLESLQSSYELLEANRNSEIVNSTRKNKELLQLLDEKQSALDKEGIRLRALEKEISVRLDELDKLKAELEVRSSEQENLEINLNQRAEKIEELNRLIVNKNNDMLKLKENISKALLDFNGKGLTVQNHRGNIHVSMENKLLFQSGSWDLGKQGQKAVRELGKVLQNNPNISVQIVGHTDNIPFIANENIVDNWDLSVKRATSVVKMLLQNININPKNITAAGKSQFDTLTQNRTDEERAKNRRIDVILTPNLDKISSLLNIGNEIHNSPTDQNQGK